MLALFTLFHFFISQEFSSNLEFERVFYQLEKWKRGKILCLLRETGNKSESVLVPNQYISSITFSPSPPRHIYSCDTFCLQLGMYFFLQDIGFWKGGNHKNARRACSQGLYPSLHPEKKLLVTDQQIFKFSSDVVMWDTKYFPSFRKGALACQSFPS